MGVADRYNKKKKKTGVSASSSSAENTGVAGRYSAKFAPTKEDLTEQEKKDGGWFKAPLFDDGYDFGDVSRTILGTFTDVEENVHTAVFDATENLIDTVAYGVGAVGGLFSDDFQEGVGDFIAKDLLHSKEAGEFLGKTTPHGLLNMIVNGDTEDASVLGDKSDQMVQSASHLVGQAALQIVGVPWWVTAGVNSFGSEIESAFQQDATYGEAGLSGAISAGAEILTEKISGGIKFGGKALDDVVTDKLAKGISNKVVKSLVKFGWDAAGEGGEEILSGAISAIGQKITYADDKELNELFSSEDAWDAFIGGAVLGGGNSAINSVKNSQGGRDPISVLTDNEQKVLDSVYNERIAEAEKDGKTLTKKEKNEIYDQVHEELKKGYISTDTIESVLGGDTYKSYKDTVDGEEAILKEYEELGNKTNPTLKEQARYAELQAKVKEIEGNSQRSQLKSQLSEEVYGQLTRDVKGKTQTDNYLLESYNEQTRRGQAFEADVSKYKGKQAEVIQKAIDSGILNNTNRTHEFVDMLAKLSADKGVLFDFANNEKIKSSGFAVDGKTVNGFVTKDGVTLNIQSSKALNTVVGHEITHVLEGTELYTALQEAVTEYARTKGEYDSRYKALEDLYKNVEGADINAELTADLIGDYLFTDQDFVNNLSVKNRNVFQKIYDEIKYLCKVATAGSKEARELEKVKRAFDKAYKESGNATADTKYSMSEITDSDGKTLTKEQSEYFKDSKMRDDNGNLMVMYHGSQDAGFHVFDASMSDDDTSFFFVDRNDVAASYSGTSETYEAQTIHTAEDMNKFIESIGAEGYEVVEKDGKFTLLYEGDRVADSDTAQGIYNEFCWYEGVGEGDANYKVYLNLKNPLVVDAEGRNWNNVSREFSQEIADRYNSLTEEEKAALSNLAEWGEYSIFKDEMLDARAAAEQGVSSGYGDVAFTKTLARAYAKLGGANANLYDAFSIAQENFSEESIKEFAVKQMNTRDYAKRAKEQGYDGVIFKNLVDIGGYGNGSEGASTVAIAFESNQIKSVANEKPTGNADIRYSLSEDSEGRELNPAVKKRFGNSKVVDENGSLKVVYHGTASGEFTIFDKSKGSVEGDYGSGFYFTDSEYDVSNNYEDGGPDFDNKVARRADAIYGEEEDITYEEAQKMARAELYRGGHKFEVYLNIENPAIVGETVLFDPDTYYSEYDQDDYDNEDDYYGDVEQLIVDDIDGIIWDIENNVDVDRTDGISEVLWTAVNEGGIDLETLKKRINSLYLEDSNGNMVGNEVARQIVETLGYDGIIDPTVSSKWNMDMESGTTHYIVFKPNQIKAVTNQNPTDNPDIHRSLSAEGEQPKRYGNYNVSGKDIALEAPIQEETTTEQNISEAEQVAPATNSAPSVVLYNKRSGADGWGEIYGTAQEALNDAVKSVNAELWEAINKEVESNNAETHIINALIAAQEDVRQETITPIQAAQLLSEAYNHGGADTLKRLYNHNTGNLLPRYLEKAKQYETAAPMRETYQEDFAPISEEEVNAMFPNEPNLFDLENEAKSLEEQIRKSYEENDVATLEKSLAQYDTLQKKIKQTEAEEKARNSEILSSLDDTDAPSEMEAPYYETRDTAPLSENDVTAIAEGVQSILGFDKSEMPKMREIIQKHATSETPNYEALYNDVKENFGSFEDIVWVDELLPDIKKQIRKYRFKQSDFIKGEMAYLNDGKYGNFRKRYFGKFMLTKDGQSIDTIYGELNELYPEHFPSDIDNSAEQLLRIVEVVDSKGEEYAEYEIDDETIREVTDDIIRKISNARTIEAESFAEEERKALFEHADEYAPFGEDFAPIAESKEAPTYETRKVNQVNGQLTMFAEEQTAEDEASATIDEILSAPIGEEAKAKHESKTAQILTEEPETSNKKDRLWSKFKTNFVDKGSVFEKLSLKTKNRELMSKWNYTLYSEARAQRLMGNGTEGVKSLNDIRAEVEKSGRTKDFYEYLYHKHNVDRMSLESKAAPTIEALKGKFGHLKIAQVRAIAAHKITEKTTEKTAQTVREAKEYLNAIETKNKPVFGFDVTAEQSQEIVDQYEVANPEFKEYAQDVYTYMNYLRGQMVESGVISQETADLWANMYPHYVPIRRAGDAGLAVNVPLDTGKTGINAPIKRATGGNRDILPLFDTMAMRTEQTYKAIARNNFGVELKNTLGSTIESNATNLDDVIDSIDTQDGLLQEGKNGQNPTFTVFENGERVTFEITEDMYEALKPTSDGLRTTVKPLNKASKWHRGILTEYNPVFMVTNAIKDVQDILINSQHPAQTYKNLPKAIKELSTKGKWYTEYMENGGEQNTYFDGQTNTFKAEDKGFVKTFGMPIRAIKAANNFVERAPRLAEYIASREAGESVETAMLNSARVTTNFAAGGDVTKFLDRNGATFLNASVQGFNQQVRNIKEAKANGLKGWVGLAAKVAIAGLPAILLNNLVWDDDEEYEELSDYVKDNYYIVAKYGDGKFVRIPKGRTVAVIQNAFTQVSNTATGDDEADFNRFFDLFLTNLSPNNPIDNNILSPIVDVAQNEAWYGGDLVPTRLQDLPAAEQYDESTDSISKWLGEKINVSPYKINYLLDQYSGGIGDVVLPMLTPEAENGGVFAPLADKFTTDSVMKNQNVSDFYDTADELTANANSSKATTEDILKSKYINAVSAEMSDLYKEKREIQNSDMSDDEKREAVRDIQRQIDELAKEGLNSYNDMTIYNGFATVGDKLYKRNKDGEWEKISEKQREKQEEVTEELGIDPATYWGNKSEYDFAYEYPEKYAVAKAIGGYEAYKTYSSELYDIKADKDENGKSISGSRKEKVIEYINGLDADYYERIILFKNEYNADDTYNYEILEYLNSREDISYEDMVAILKELGFEIGSDGVSVTW